MPPVRSDDGVPTYSHSEAEGIALAASKTAVTQIMQEFFAMFGVNYANFESRDDFRRDMEFLRSLREMPDLRSDFRFVGSVRSGARKAGSRFVMAVVSIIAAGFVYGMWEGIKVLLHKP